MELEKARDARLRRLARRLGFSLSKAGTRYILLEGRTHRSYWPSIPFLTADEVEEFLKRYQENHSGKLEEGTGS